MNVLCSAKACPVLLSSTCVFYEGENLIYTGINTNDNLQEALQKIDEAFGNAVLNISAVLPISITAGPNPIISISQASATSNGYISSTDWNIFNNKQNAVSLTTVGSTGPSTFNSLSGALNIPDYSVAFPGFVPTTRTLSINGTSYDLSANRTWNVGTVTSVGITMPPAFNVSNSPITSSGVIGITAAGLASQYVRGDGLLGDFPSGGGGGSAVSYYLNGSVNQGTFGGSTYYEINKTPVIGGPGTNFSITNTVGLISQFITDPLDPGLLLIPAGNWNIEFYFNSSDVTGAPYFYVELYIYNGTTFTLISSGAANPEYITNGTSVDIYFTSIAVPETIITVNDRFAIRVYGNTDGNRTITLHTEGDNLSQIVTTFSNGLTALNGLTRQVQYFATGSAGTDFAINSSIDIHTFNLPTASSTNRGALSSADWIIFNSKVGGSGATGQVAYWTGATTQAGSNNLFWNSANNRLGINTATPTTALQVVGTGYITENLRFDGQLRDNRDNGIIQQSLSSVITNRILTIGNATYLNINFPNGNILVGTTTDAGFKLDVNGTARVSGASTFNNSLTNTTGGFAHSSASSTNDAFYTSLSSNIRFYVNANGYCKSTSNIVSDANGATSLNASAISQIDSTTKGFLQPRLTTVQRDAIATPATGLQVYNTTTNTNDYYNGTSWLSEGNVSGSGTTGQVAYWNGTSSQTGSNNLFWDVTNTRLGIGTNSPSRTLDVRGSARIEAAGNAEFDIIGGGGNILRVATTSTSTFIGSMTGTPFLFFTGANERARFFATGNFNIGGTTDGGQRLQVIGDAFIKGSGATSATSSLVVQDSAGTAMLTLRNDGVLRVQKSYINLSSDLNNGIGASNDGSSFVSSGGGIMYATPNRTSSGVGHGFYGGNITNTSGEFSHLRTTGRPNFAPTSGTGTFSIAFLEATINQSGGANGITRGLYVNPTLTSAFDFRAIETTAGNVLFGSNFFWNNTNNRLGINTSTPASALQVVGTVNATNVQTPLVFSTGADPLTFATQGGTSAMVIQPVTRNVIIQNAGAISDGGQRLQVQGTTLLNGITTIQGSTNNDTTQLLRVNQQNGNSRFFVNALGQTSIQGDAYGSTDVLLRIDRNFNPTSGTATHTTLIAIPTINQTGGANGITRGIYVAPILTAAADWRSIEWSNNSGWGLYGAGTAANLLNGNLGIGGSDTVFNQKLYINGNIRIQDGGGVGNTNSTTSEWVKFNSVIGLLFGTNGSERARITTAGRLLLGTTTENTFLLDVNGSARVSGGTLNDLFIVRSGTLGQSIVNIDTSTFSGDRVPFSVKGHASQAYNFLQIGKSGNEDIFKIDSSGKIGINNTNPTGQLDVSGGLGTFRVLTSGAELYLTRNGNNDFFANGGTSAELSIGANNNLKFLTGSTLTERARITSGGNLLVGTTADQGYRVQITGSGDNMLNVWGATAPSIRLDNAASGATQRFVLGLATATNNFIQGASAGDVCITTATASPIVFGMWQTSTASEVMRITTSNNLLVGTTVDNGQKLQVSGAILATSFVKSGGTSSQYLMADGSVTTGGGGGSVDELQVALISQVFG